MPKIQNSNSSSNGNCQTFVTINLIKEIKPSQYMTKIGTFDGAGFWKNAYAHQRSKLLKIVQVPDDQLVNLVNKKYVELPAALKYEIETSGIDKKVLL